jgi:hypothetical protein
MFGSGANGSLKYNRGQRLEKRSFKDISASYGESDRIINDKKLTPQQFERFKVQLQEKRRREFFIAILTFLIISFSVTSAFILVLR